MSPLTIQHVEIRVSDIPQTKAFYVDKLGLEIIQEIPSIKLMALKAGHVRISVFEGLENKGEGVNRHLIFRTDDIVQTKAELEAKGLIFPKDIMEAPGFLKFISTVDPDGNRIEFAEYLRDPLS